MPQVPGLDNAPLLNQNVPGVQLPYRGEFTRLGQATENLGQSLEGTAKTGAEIYDSIQVQHDLSTASKAATNMKVAHEQLAQNIQNSSPDGFIYDDVTGAPSTNKDGSPRTIAQEYWDQADSDYQERQENLSPRAAAMFRQKAQETIASNTQGLQVAQLGMQRKASDQTVTDNINADKKSFDTSFVPSGVTSAGAYYTAPGENGSTKEYPSAAKLYDAIQDRLLDRQQQGRMGGFNPTEIKQKQEADAADLADHWLTAGKLDLIESSGSRAKLHDTLKDASSTAVMQVHSLLDIVEGKDPQSGRRSSLGLPTVNSSLMPDQIEKWRADLLGMVPAAKEVDKSEFNLNSKLLEDYAKGVKSMDQFNNSPLFQKTLLMSGGLGLTPAERIEKFMPSVAAAVTSSANAATTGIASPEAKRQAADAALASGRKYFPQLAQMLGEKNTEGFGEAISTEASKQVAAKLQEDEKQMRANPMGYMAGIQEGPQGPNGTPKYRSAMAHAIENQLDPKTDPSLLSIFKPMSGGKSVLENAQGTANNGYARMFGSKTDVAILSKNQFEDQAKRITSSNDPKLITDYFKQLDQQNISSAEKESFIQHLVSQGGLKQTYVDALNLHTPAEREARWAAIQSGPLPMPDGYTRKRIEAISAQENKGLFSFLNVKSGPNSPATLTARNTYDQSWQRDFTAALGRGLGESDAKGFANDQRDKTTGAIGIVGGQHDFFGTGLIHYGKSGPQVLIEYGSNNYTPAQQQTINDTLLYAQSKEMLGKHKVVAAPGSLPPNENAPTNEENAADKAVFWRKIGGGWRLQVQEVDKNNRPTGINQDLQVMDSNGKPHTYDWTESQALAGPPKGAPKAVAPPSKVTPATPYERPGL